VVKLAGEAGLPPARMAVAWVLAQPGVTCTIVGASRAEQLPDVLAADETVLDPGLLARLDEATRDFRRGDAER
jgi:aryl-alcohol dehydrogenase-like predicted oxidoreductase